MLLNNPLMVDNLLCSYEISQREQLWSRQFKHWKGRGVEEEIGGRGEKKERGRTQQQIAWIWP